MQSHRFALYADSPFLLAACVVMLPPHVTRRCSWTRRVSVKYRRARPVQRVFGAPSALRDAMRHATLSRAQRHTSLPRPSYGSSLSCGPTTTQPSCACCRAYATPTTRTHRTLSSSLQHLIPQRSPSGPLSGVPCPTPSKHFARKGRENAPMAAQCRCASLARFPPQVNSSPVMACLLQPDSRNPGVSRPSEGPALGVSLFMRAAVRGA